MVNALLERLRAARLHQQRRFSDVDALVRASIGLHSTDYASPYLSAWARVDRLDPAALFARLNTGKGLVRLNAFRNTVHVVHVDDLALISAATGEAVSQVGRRWPELKGVSETEVKRGVQVLLSALDAGPLTTNQLKEAAPELAGAQRAWLLLAMGTGEVIRADAPHARSNRSRYARTSQWIPGYRRSELPAAEARRLVLGRAIAAFGPLTEADLSWWLPAPLGEVKRALKSFGKDVSSVEVEGIRYWFTPDLADAPALPREALGAWVLPYEDALLKAYKDREWCLAPGLREVVFPHNVRHWYPPDGKSPGPGPHGGVNVSGEARPSIWWAGRVVGRWEEADRGVVRQVHVDVGAEGAAAIEAEIERVSRFLAEGLGPIAWSAQPASAGGVRGPSPRLS